MGVTSPSGGVHTYMASAVRSPLGFRWALGGWRPVLALAGLARVAVGRSLCARAGCAFTPARTAQTQAVRAGVYRREIRATAARNTAGAIPIATGLSAAGVPGGADVCRRACCMPAVLPAGRPVRD